MTPNTTVTLYATDFDISNRYVIAAASAGEALGILGAYPSQVYNNCYWQRTDDFVFRCNGNINEVEQYNYCVFLNNGRYNFAFITKCQYVNDAMTWVYLTIDPWLNFAGQYVFHDSPMRRAHPRSDGQTEVLLSNATEPYEVDRLLAHSTPVAEPGEDDTMCYLVTAVKTTSYSNASAANYWDAIAALENGSGGNMTSYVAGIVSQVTYMNGGYQACTSLVTVSTAQDIIKAFIANGRQSDILAIYHVPKDLRGFTTESRDMAGLFLPVGGTELKVDSSTAAFQGQARWNKIKVSPQFRRIIMNACGNCVEVPIESIPLQLLLSRTDITFRYSVDNGINGCAYLKCASSVDSNVRQASTPTWDRYSINGYSPNLTDLKRNDIAQLRNISQATLGILGSILTPSPSMVSGVLGTAMDAALNQRSNTIERGEIMKEGAFTVGTPVSSITAYNQMSPVLEVIVYEPSLFDTRRLNVMFGTYGYMWSGANLPIVFKTLPYWNYYETIDASITGKQVPQKYLNQVIAMFNRGVFVFNDTSSYKDFSKAADNHY